MLATPGWLPPSVLVEEPLLVDWRNCFPMEHGPAWLVDVDVSVALGGLTQRFQVCEVMTNASLGDEDHPVPAEGPRRYRLCQSSDGLNSRVN